MKGFLGAYSDKVYSISGCYPWFSLDAVAEEKRKQKKKKRDNYGHPMDSPGQIQQCLNCQLPECIDCITRDLKRLKRAREKKCARTIPQIDGRRETQNCFTR